MALTWAAIPAPLDAQLRRIEPVDAAGRIPYFIAAGEPGSAWQPSDRELAMWAMKDWEKTLAGKVRFEPAPENVAVLQIHWVPAGAGQYGETRRIAVNGRPGAAVYVRPDTSALGPILARLAQQDALVRESIVYLTCLHEVGHALGLPHTADFRDIMYSFEFGGDIPGFFLRYRNHLATRADIATVSGLSDGDMRAVRGKYR
jgi:hypothetical protein